MRTNFVIYCTSIDYKVGPHSLYLFDTIFDYGKITKY
ncbi:hypothetical protein FLCH110379_16490 [Flavobacterium chungbukense]